MVDTVAVDGVGRAPQREVPLEQVALERRRGVVWGGGGGELLRFADWNETDMLASLDAVVV